MPEQINFKMKNNKKTSLILSLIALLLFSSTILLAYIVLETHLDIKIDPISAICIYPLLLFPALILSVIAIKLNKKQVLAWIILVLVLIVFIMSIYVFSGLKDLPIGAGTR